MANKVTKAEREALIKRADKLLQQDLDTNQVVAQLSQDVSKQRARHAVATAQMRQRRPRR